MTTFKAKVTQNIPANRLIGLGGINTEGDPEEGWETVYLILSKKGWIPDFVSTSDLKEGDTVSVTITDKPVWKVEASGNLPAGTLVQCDEEGKVIEMLQKDGHNQATRQIESVRYEHRSVLEGAGREVIAGVDNESKAELDKDLVDE